MNGGPIGDWPDNWGEMLGEAQAKAAAEHPVDFRPSHRIGTPEFKVAFGVKVQAFTAAIERSRVALDRLARRIVVFPGGSMTKRRRDADHRRSPHRRRRHGRA